MATFRDGTPVRRGQWVKFTPPSPVEAAHAAGDGKAVGIYHPGGVEPTPEQTPYPDRVYPVRGNGTNVVILGDDDQARTLYYEPASLADLAPAEVPGDLPRCPRTEHLFGEG
jgi:hypothetical protein